MTATSWARLLVACVVAAGKAGAQADACSLLSPAAIRRAMGEEVTNAKASFQDAGAVHHSQCFFTLRTFTNSISLTLTQPAKADAHHRAALDLWQRWFHRDADHDADRKQPESEEEEAAAKAVPVAGIGDEAFWVHSFVGNLYVRKGNQFLRIRLGGKMTDEARQAKAKQLAADAVRHLR